MTQNTEKLSEFETQNIAFKISNKKSNEMRFFIEPWGDEFMFTPGTTIQINASYPSGTDWIPEIVYYQNNIIAFHMYDGPGFFFELFSNGTRLRTSQDYSYPKRENEL